LFIITFLLLHHTLFTMSRSPSPVSSLDFGASDLSEDEYEYQYSSRKPAAKKAAAAGATGIKINLSALQRARAAESDGVVHDAPADGEGFLDTLTGRWGVDLSGERLKNDHAARPLWIDESGNM
jgi:hypothetical protein